jgi:hypothetical protein
MRSRKRVRKPSPRGFLKDWRTLTSLRVGRLSGGAPNSCRPGGGWPGGPRNGAIGKKEPASRPKRDKTGDRLSTFPSKVWIGPSPRPVSWLAIQPTCRPFPERQPLQWVSRGVRIAHSGGAAPESNRLPDHRGQVLRVAKQPSKDFRAVDRSRQIDWLTSLTGNNGFRYAFSRDQVFSGPRH